MSIDKPDITIRLNGNGKLEYDKDPFHAKRGQQIAWACVYPCAIQFRGETPLDEGGSPHPVNNKLMKGTVKKDAKLVAYDYACAVYANDRVYLDAACPAIIIDG
jgi:hypothetical protein